MARYCWPDLIFAGQHDAAVISRATRRGTLKRLARGIYTGAMAANETDIVRRGIWTILAHTFPGAVLVDESALAADPLASPRLQIAHPKRAPLVLPGWVIAPRVGVLGLAGDSPLAPSVWIGSPARNLLDYFARAPSQRPTWLFADWFARERESFGSLKQLMVDLRRLAPKAHREKSLAQALAFVAGQMETGADAADNDGLPAKSHSAGQPAQGSLAEPPRGQPRPARALPSPAGRQSGPAGEMAMPLTGTRPVPEPREPDGQLSRAPASITPPSSPSPARFSSTPGQPDRPSALSPASLPVLSGLAQTLGATLLTQGATTRPALSRLLGLSKPTVSAGMEELLAVDLVQPLCLQAQQKGRAAKVYGIGKRAGWVLGVDMGNYQALFIARCLEGNILAQRRIANPSFQQLIGGASALLQTLQQGLRQHGPLYGVTLALSQAIRQDVVQSGREGPSQAGLTPDEILARLHITGPATLRLENNVNCAVAAEAISGAAKGLRDVVFLQIGSHIGAGIIAGGQLIRGVRGCAGEVADMPFPWSRTESPVELMMEQHLGYPDDMQGLNPTASAGEGRRLPELLARADAGEPTALRVIQAYGKQVGYLAMGLVATLDPAMLVLGGPVGGHRIICAAVRKQVRQLSAHTEVVATFYGEAATAEGAVTLARDGVLRQLFGTAYRGNVRLVPGGY